MLKTSFIGRLGADAETFNGKNGQFLSFRVATDDYYKGENTTVWVNVTINQDRVGNMKLTKGSHVFIRGLNDDLRQVFAMTGFTNLFEFK